MSASLENKTSLRKLEFPNSTQEALSRLFNTFSARSGSSMTLTMPPKETELILVTKLSTQVILDTLDNSQLWRNPKNALDLPNKTIKTVGDGNQLVTGAICIMLFFKGTKAKATPKLKFRCGSSLVSPRGLFTGYLRIEWLYLLLVILFSPFVPV